MSDISKSIEELQAVKSEYSNKNMGDKRLMKSEVKAINDGIYALKVFNNALYAGFQNKEVEFYIGGRKFAIRELAQ